LSTASTARRNRVPISAMGKLVRKARNWVGSNACSIGI
jgi:hypothetical protein